MTPTLVSLVLFVFGLAVGSLVNVIALRYRLSGKLLTASVVSGRSQCMACQRQLRWYELVPLFSFVVQRGRCRTCSAKLSFQYPIIELLVGFIFVFVPSRIQDVYHLWNASASTDTLWLFVLLTAIWLIAFVLLILILLIDTKLFVIPDQINISLAVLGILGIVVSNHFGSFGLVEGSFLGHHTLLFGFRDSIWLNHILGAAIGFVVFGLIAFLSRGRAMGWGDVKLIAALGLLFGWAEVIIIMFLAFVIGSLGSLVLLVSRKKTMKDIIPFGPYITIGAAIVFFYGIELLSGYFNLFGLV